jgi:hypothetical protein
MFQMRDEKWLLGEVRRAMTELTITEQLILGDRFGLRERLELGLDGPVVLPQEEARRWIEIRALRKLRASGLSLRNGRDSAPPGYGRRSEGSVIIPLHPKDPNEAWPPRFDPIPEPERPDNKLWDEV